MDNSSIASLISVFEDTDIIPKSSSTAPSNSLGEKKVRRDSIAYYCEKCKISTFYSSEKKCGVCGYNFGWMVR